MGANSECTWRQNVGTESEPRYINRLNHQDMLLHAVPDTRIMRYGYESHWFGRDATRNGVRNVARRLLLALKRKRVVGNSMIMFEAVRR
jgi:hypothetical protein